jgi:hypothetical protein
MISEWILVVIECDWNILHYFAGSQLQDCQLLPVSSWGLFSQGLRMTTKSKGQRFGATSVSFSKIFVANLNKIKLGP